MTKKKVLIALIISALMILFSACGAAESSKENEDTSGEAVVNDKESDASEIRVIDSKGSIVNISMGEADLLMGYVEGAIDKNEKCERLKYLFTNEVFYVDKDGKEYSFKFTTPFYVETDKESMILVQDGDKEGYCLKIDVEFYNKLQEIQENTGADFSAD